MYRKTNKRAAICKKMREGKERKRLEGDPPDYPAELPDLRRRIIVEDYDSGEMVRHEFEMHKTSRGNCYRVVVDGVEWKKKIGWSRILEGLRKALPGVRA